MSTFHFLNGEKFKWNGTNGHANFYDLGLNVFPSHGFYIRSHKTGTSMLFLPDHKTNEENEFFDGEGAAFFAPGFDVRVRIWNGG